MFLIGSFMLSPMMDVPVLSGFYWVVLCWTIGMYAATAVGRTKMSRLLILVYGSC